MWSGVWIIRSSLQAGICIHAPVISKFLFRIAAFPTATAPRAGSRLRRDLGTFGDETPPPRRPLGAPNLDIPPGSPSSHISEKEYLVASASPSLSFHWRGDFMFPISRHLLIILDDQSATLRRAPSCAACCRNGFWSARMVYVHSTALILPPLSVVREGAYGTEIGRDFQTGTTRALLMRLTPL